MSTSSDSDGSYSRLHSRSSKAKTYECKICGNEFNSGQSLGGHMNVHRKDQRSSRSSRSSTESSHYASSSVDSSSTYKGVRYRSEQNKWVAEIRPPKSSKTWWLGTYNTAIEAAYAYDVAIIYFNSETSLNFYGHPVYDQIPRISPNLPKQDFAVQLRKVVKEYGKLAMESGPSPDHQVEDEEEASSSLYDQYINPDYNEHQQQTGSFGLDFIDWNTVDNAGPNFIEDVDHSSFSPQYYDHSSFNDVEMPPLDAFESHNYTAYNPEPANYATSYNYSQMSPTMSDYDPNGHYNGYSYPQQQLWSPCYRGY